MSASLRFFDPAERRRAAGHASLRYVRCADAGILRVKRGKGFAYRLPNGKWLTDAAELERIRKLALPPAWNEVWICADKHGHLQATGIDARGRKQYRYDARWREVRDEAKYRDLLELAERLPRLRRALERDLATRDLNRDKVLAAVVTLMVRTGARVGNERYAEENGSFGLTTLRDRHAKLSGRGVVLSFRGKGGKPYVARVQDQALARIIKRCRDVPGQRLFQYLDPQGRRQSVRAGDVNGYVQRLAGARVTAKTFRTWVASVRALAELRKLEPALSLTARKRQLNAALTCVANHLGNTLAICRRSYVHPALSQSFLAGELPAAHRSRRAGLTEEECDLVAVLEAFSRPRRAAA
jgi:DNA topoisomerase I